MKRKRGLSRGRAQHIRQSGHNEALRFALAIGLDDTYQNDIKAKKDVIDPSGDAHSIKAGEKKWQVFLYRRSRFVNDYGFRGMSGIGELLIQCIDAFPASFEDYLADKDVAKQRLREPMVAIKEKLQKKGLLGAFLRKSFFNDGVTYLTVSDKGRFHVLLSDDVVRVLVENFTVNNSFARTSIQTDEQKVIFQYDNLNVGELEMRNDSIKHYREMRFNMIKPRIMKLLWSFISRTAIYNKHVWVYGNAVKCFGRWK